MELTEQDKHRIRLEARNRFLQSDRDQNFIDGAEYATRWEREQQAKEIEKLKELLRTAEGALRFAGLERTADVIEKALNE